MLNVYRSLSIEDKTDVLITSQSRTLCRCLNFANINILIHLLSSLNKLKLWTSMIYIFTTEVHRCSNLIKQFYRQIQISKETHTKNAAIVWTLKGTRSVALTELESRECNGCCIRHAMPYSCKMSQTVDYINIPVF